MHSISHDAQFLRVKLVWETSAQMTDVSSLVARAMHRDAMHDVDEVLNSEVWLHKQESRHHCTSPRQCTVALHDVEEDWRRRGKSASVNNAQIYTSCRTKPTTRIHMLVQVANLHRMILISPPTLTILRSGREEVN